MERHLSISSQNLIQNGSSKPKRAASYDDKEVYNLLNIWSSESVQRMFKTCRRHNLVYAYIAQEHSKNQKYERLGCEVKNKINNLKTTYRSLKPNSGGKPPTWQFYDIIHRVLGQSDSCNPDLLDDRLSSHMGQESDHQDDDDEQSEKLLERSDDIDSCSFADQNSNNGTPNPTINSQNCSAPKKIPYGSVPMNSSIPAKVSIPQNQSFNQLNDNNVHRSQTQQNELENNQRFPLYTLSTTTSYARRERSRFNRSNSFIDNNDGSINNSTDFDGDHYLENMPVAINNSFSSTLQQSSNVSSRQNVFETSKNHSSFHRDKLNYSNAVINIDSDMQEKTLLPKNSGRKKFVPKKPTMTSNTIVKRQFACQSFGNQRKLIKITDDTQQNTEEDVAVNNEMHPSIDTQNDDNESIEQVFQSSVRNSNYKKLVFGGRSLPQLNCHNPENTLTEENFHKNSAIEQTFHSPAKLQNYQTQSTYQDHRSTLAKETLVSTQNSQISSIEQTCQYSLRSRKCKKFGLEGKSQFQSSGKDLENLPSEGNSQLSATTHNGKLSSIEQTFNSPVMNLNQHTAIFEENSQPELNYLNEPDLQSSLLEQKSDYETESNLDTDSAEENSVGVPFDTLIDEISSEDEYND